jgi:hypothetical protein
MSLTNTDVISMIAKMSGTQLLVKRHKSFTASVRCGICGDPSTGTATWFVAEASLKVSLCEQCLKNIELDIDDAGTMVGDEIAIGSVEAAWAKTKLKTRKQ